VCLGTQFVGDSHASGFRCVEMENGLPWSAQVDLYGVAATLHTLLFGSYMNEILPDSPCFAAPSMPSPGNALISSAPCVRPQQAFKRYWAKDLWREIFHDLMNFKCEHFKDKKHDFVEPSLKDSLHSSSELLLRLRLRILDHLQSSPSVQETSRRLMNKQHIMMNDMFKLVR
jgi:hypothetical protein